MAKNPSQIATPFGTWLSVQQFVENNPEYTIPQVRYYLRSKSPKNKDWFYKDVSTPNNPTPEVVEEVKKKKFGIF